jgi:hypothetical protein
VFLLPKSFVESNQNIFINAFALWFVQISDVVFGAVVIIVFVPKLEDFSVAVFVTTAVDITRTFGGVTGAPF